MAEYPKTMYRSVSDYQMAHDKDREDELREQKYVSLRELRKEQQAEIAADNAARAKRQKEEEKKRLAGADKD